MVTKRRKGIRAAEEAYAQSSPWKVHRNAAQALQATTSATNAIGRNELSVRTEIRTTRTWASCGCSGPSASAVRASVTDTPVRSPGERIMPALVQLPDHPGGV